MNWTSEFQPPPPRPNLDDDAPADNGFEVIDLAPRAPAADDNGHHIAETADDAEDPEDCEVTAPDDDDQTDEDLSADAGSDDHRALSDVENGDVESSDIESSEVDNSDAAATAEPAETDDEGPVELEADRHVSDEASIDEAVDDARDDEAVGDGGLDVDPDDIWTDVSNQPAIPDEGPLDPAVFDGLFADLGVAEQPTVDDLETDDLEADEVEDGGFEDGVFEVQHPEVEVIDVEDEQPLGDAVDRFSPFEPAPPTEPTPRDLAEPTDSIAGSVFEQVDAGDESVGDSDPNRAGLQGAFDPAATLFGVDAEPRQPDRPSPTPSSETVDIGQSEFEGERFDHGTEVVHPLEQPRIVVESGHADPAVHHHIDEPALIGNAAVAQPQVTGQPDLRYQEAKPERRWPAFAIATLIGAGLGIGGAIILSQLIGSSGDGNQAATQTTVPAADTGTGTGTGSTDTSVVVDDGGQEQPTGIANLVSEGRLELNTIRFVPGTSNLTEGSLTTLSELAAATAEAPAAPLSVAVRTYSEPTAADNLLLSEQQARAITDYLTGLGMPAGSVLATGLGAPPLSPSQPVQNFVVVNAGLQPSALKTTLQGLSPFAVGLDPTTGRLRPESLEPLDIVGRAMSTDSETPVSLAAYSYDRPDAASNQSQAAVAAEAVAAYLATNYEIDGARLSILTPGQAPYIVSASAGNHIFVQWGRTGTIAAAISAVDQEAIAFGPGSAKLDEPAAAALDQLIEVVGPSDRTVVIDVHTATEANDDANARLAERQAEAIAAHLTAGGLPENRFRIFGGGSLRQFQNGERLSRVVITSVP